jgi:hypothetical protein
LFESETEEIEEEEKRKRRDKGSEYGRKGKEKKILRIGCLGYRKTTVSVRI